MPAPEQVQEMLLRGKREGKLKPEYLTMTDEEYLDQFNKKWDAIQKEKAAQGGTTSQTSSSSEQQK